MSVAGIHHVTAICGDARRNLAFYGDTLGMRLVKRTVNYEDPSTWHFYFGDEAGRPGTLLTFFPWANAARGWQGVGQAAVVALAIPPASVGWWLERLMARVPDFDGPARRRDETVLAFRDPDGMLLELVTSPAAAEVPGWAGSVPAAHAVRGVHSVTLWESDASVTAAVLTGVLGFRADGEREPHVRRYVTGGGAGGLGGIVDVRDAAGFWEGRTGRGTVHHVAFRAPDDATEMVLREQAVAMGLEPTPQIDRTYFRSVYFREPGGVLFELATDDPGFTVDEPLDALGARLTLPPWLEARRDAIARRLPAVELPPADAPHPFEPLDADARPP